MTPEGVGAVIAVQSDAIERNRFIKFLAGVIKAAISRQVYVIPQKNTPRGGVLPCAPQSPFQRHGPVHRLRHWHRGGGTHHNRFDGRVVALMPIKEVSIQLRPMSQKQAIVLIVLLSLGLWVLIWGLVVAIMTLIGG